MTTITFPTGAQYEFSLQFVQRPTGMLFGAKAHREAFQIEIDHPVMARLLQRVADGRTVVLPYVAGTTTTWIITGPTRRDLEQTLARASHFVVPTYADYPGSSHAPAHSVFDPQENALQRYGGQLYEAGYYRWQSPARHLDMMFKRLDLWLQLESKQPTLRAVNRPTYRELYDAFIEALAATNWSGAEEALAELRAQFLSSADNLTSLEIQLNTRRQAWRAIWEREDFADLAKMRIPRETRAALLTAFHHSELLPLEQQGRWDVALEVHRAARSRLGLLLTGRFGLTDAPVLHVFAYEAVCAQDRDGFESLRRVRGVERVQQCLDALEHFLVPQEQRAADTPLQAAKRALANDDLDAASSSAALVEDLAIRALLLIDIAMRSEDIEVAESALQAFALLPTEIQSDLRAQHVRVTPCIKVLSELTGAPLAPSTQVVTTWLDWFEFAERHPGAKELLPALDHLMKVTDDRYWTAETVTSLSDKLFNFLETPGQRTRSSCVQAVRSLTTTFLNDPYFPRDEPSYAQLYETLYYGYYETNETTKDTSMTLRRLADAILQHAPARRESIFKNFAEWFKTPVLAFEGIVLSVFEMVGDAGLAPGAMATLYRSWARFLIDSPRVRDRFLLEAWLAFGEWIQPGEDLLAGLRDALKRATEIQREDPVAELAPGYRIAVFTLYPPAAERARAQLLKRNPGLIVTICDEHDMNNQVRALAENAQMVVLVWTCLKHALYYGVSSIIKSEPVYPTSKGETSIIRAIEERLVVKGTARVGKSA